MNHSLGRFSLVCFLLAIALYFISDNLHQKFLNEKPGAFIYFLFAWFPFITIINYYLLLKAVVNKPRTFVTSYYLTVMIRMFASVFVLVFYLLTTDHQPFATVTIFGALYMIYFIIELIYLTKLVKSQNAKVA